MTEHAHSAAHGGGDVDLIFNVQQRTAVVSLRTLQHLGKAVERCGQGEDRGHIVGTIDVCAGKNLLPSGPPRLHAETTIVPPVAIHGRFTVYMLQQQSRPIPAAQVDEVERGIADVDLPVVDACCLAQRLKLLVSAAARCIAAPQRGGAPV